MFSFLGTFFQMHGNRFDTIRVDVLMKIFIAAAWAQAFKQGVVQHR